MEMVVVQDSVEDGVCSGDGDSGGGVGIGGG